MAERRQVVVDLITRTGGGTTGIKSLQTDLGKVGSSSAQANTQLKGLRGQLGGVKRGALGVAPALSGTAVAAGAIGGGLLLAGKGIQSSISAFASFDDKLNQSQAIMGDLSETMRGEMSDAAREVAKTTRLSADEAAESYFFLASAGLDAEQSIAALPAVAAFAQAGMFDMATATDLATDAQSALGLTSDNAAENLSGLTRVTDVFVKANTLANTSVQQVSEAITNKLGASLRSYNIDLEEGTAVLAAYADQGIKGAAAGESLNIVLRDLKRAATENRDAFSAAGVEVFDSQGNFRNLADVVADLEGAFGGLSVEQQTFLAQQLGFQDRSFKNIQALLGTSDAIREYEAELRQAGGTTAEVADKQLDSFSGQMDLIKGQVGDVGLTIGEALAPAVLDAAKGIGTFIEQAGPMLKVLGQISSLTLKLVTGPLKLLGDGIEAVTSFFDEGTEQGLRFKEAQEGVAKAIEDGENGAAAYANGLLHMAKNGALTAERINELGEGVEFAGEQQAVAIRDVLEYARANGVAAEQLEMLEGALRAEIDASARSAQEKENLQRELGILEGAVDGADRKFLGLVESTEDLEDGMDGAADAMEDGAEEAKTLAERLSEAEAAQEGLAGVLKAAASPVFAAVKSFKDYQSAIEKYQEVAADSESTAEDLALAQLEVAEAALEAQAGLDALSPEALEEALAVVAEALQISADEAAELLEELGLLDGKTVTTVVETSFRTRGTPPPLIGVGGPRQHGGPVRPHLAHLVGEAGPELFIPDQPGRILPAGRTQTMMSEQLTRERPIQPITIQVINPMHREDDVLDSLQKATTLVGLVGTAETAPGAG